jgi:hypothetical protein
MGIQSYFLRKKIKAFSKQKASGYLTKVQKVAIIVDESSGFKHNHYKNLLKLMKLNDDQCNILTIKHKKSNYNEFKGIFLLKNEVNWKGEFRAKELQQFTDLNYDLLINFIPKHTALTELLVARVNALFKVGFAGGTKDFYNITFNIDAEKVDLFILELVKYLNILKVL